MADGRDDYAIGAMMTKEGSALHLVGRRMTMLNIASHISWYLLNMQQ